MTNTRIEKRVAPAEAIKMAKRMKDRPTFFVMGGTPLWTSEDHYLPLAGNVQVTRREMINYLEKLQETAKLRKECSGEDITINVHILGCCFFV